MATAKQNNKPNKAQQKQQQKPTENGRRKKKASEQRMSVSSRIRTPIIRAVYRFLIL